MSFCGSTRHAHSPRHGPQFGATEVVRVTIVLVGEGANARARR
jgi:hypothetical protein